MEAARGVPSRVHGAGCRVQGAGCRVQGAGCRGAAALCALPRCARAPGKGCCRTVHVSRAERPFGWNVDNVNKLWSRPPFFWQKCYFLWT
jgi:hypothetical protein